MVLSKDLDTPNMNIKNIIGLVIIENHCNVKIEGVLFTSAFVKFAVMILCVNLAHYSFYLHHKSKHTHVSCLIECGKSRFLRVTG